MRLAPLLCSTLLLSSLPTTVHPQAPSAARRSSAAPQTERNTQLPVTRVALYKNGVGFFEHTGHVTGNQSVTIDFTSGQLNDVLQTLTAIDLNGGRISGAGYNSATPLDQQLKALPLALGEDSSVAELYTVIRGAHVEVNGSGATFTGRILSMETRSIAGPTETAPATEKRFLTVISDAGAIRSIELTSATQVRLLDTSLHTDLNRYLELIANNRSQGLRHLTLQDNGAGTRDLRVSYISEVPIWKSTYRILITSDPRSTAPQTATLQGWSVVDNTTGSDWLNVQLSLIAGAPQSFLQPLSQPIYARRPEIPIAQEAQLTPQTHQSGDVISKDIQMLKEDAAPPPAPAGRAGMGSGYGSAIAQRHAGIAGGVMGGIGSINQSVDVNAVAPMIGYESAAADSLTKRLASTAAFDDYFEYKLTAPVTIRKNESALVPILQSKIDATRVTIASYRNGSVSQPLRALWVTNTTGLTLDRGSFTLIENGNFAGEGLLDPIHPSEKRLLSYAADQSVHVSTEGDKTTNRITLLRGSRGVLTIHRADIHEVTFVLHNAAADHRTVITEVPVIAGWTLDSDPKPEETTATVYRFRTELDPGQTVRLHVGGKRNGFTSYNLSSTNNQQIEFFLNETSHNPTLEAAIQPILEARRRVADAQTAVDAVNQRLTALHADEERQRENITALKDADRSARQRFVNELNQSEDQIAQQQKELIARSATLKAAQEDLANKIESLQINETLN